MVRDSTPLRRAAARAAGTLRQCLGAAEEAAAGRERRMAADAARDVRNARE